MMNTISKALLALSFIFIFIVATGSSDQSWAAMKKSAWDKIDYSQDLYGLPHVVDFRGEKFDKIDYSQDLYGLPHVVDFRGEKFEKIDYGQDLYGLPHVMPVH